MLSERPRRPPIALPAPSSRVSAPLAQAAWRQRQQKTAAGSPSSKLEKLRRSVRGRLVASFSHEVIDAAIGDVIRIIETHWNK